MHSTSLCSLALAAAACALAGCSNSSGGSHGNSQVVARANGQEISLHQVNFVLSKAGEVPAEKLDGVRKSVLDRLIDQELLAAKAVEAKLDRAPATVMAIELARKEILARAYAEQVVTNGPKLDPGDVVRYYAKHSELFENRQVFGLEETLFQAPPEVVAQVRNLVEHKASMDKVKDYLQGQKIAFKSQAGVVPPERVRPQFLKQLQDAHVGDLLVHEDNTGISVVRVAAARKDAVDEATATPVIRRLLANQHAAKLAEQELKAIKAKSKIEYLGAFAEAGAPRSPDGATVQAAGDGPAKAAGK